MSDEVYLILTGSDQSPDVIFSRNSSLRIKVFSLDRMTFTPAEDEIQLYAYFKDDLLVFETLQISAEDALDMIPAIRWYAKYLDYPQLEILPEDPRLAQEDIAV